MGAGYDVSWLGTTLLCGAILLGASIALAIPLSINFAHSLRLDPSPLEGQHGFLSAPKPGDGPVTVTMDFIIRPEDREKFLELAEQIRLIFLRNGAFLFNIDENLEYPGTLRMEMLLSSWAQHLLQVHGWFTLPTNLRLFAGVNLRADVSI